MQTSLPAGSKNVDEFTVDPSTGSTVVRNLESGQEAEASKEEVWEMLRAAGQAAEILVCAIHDADGDGTQAIFKGLVEGHAYSIKEVRRLDWVQRRRGLVTNGLLCLCSRINL
jgi:hypothetical protein